jgi:hypothetical protein
MYGIRKTPGRGGCTSPLYSNPAQGYTQFLILIFLIMWIVANIGIFLNKMYVSMNILPLVLSV